MMERAFLRGSRGQLETVTMGSGTQGDLLFVHGAWSSSWYWETFFMPWFAERGYRCRALSLRGHGASDGRVRWASIADYVADVRQAAEGLQNPVLIGHSMGGFIAQKYAARYPVRGLALLASVAPGGVWHAFFRVLTERPMALLRTAGTLDLYGLVSDPETARALLFSRNSSQTDKDHLLRHLKSESFRALLDMLFAPVRRHVPPGVPVTVIGAEFDQIISHGNVASTARFHGVTPVMLPLASHMLTVDDRWKDAATLLDGWLRREVLGQDQAPAPTNPTPLPITQRDPGTSQTPNRYPPQIKKRAKMLGQMQYMPLTLPSILTHAEANHPARKVWSRDLPEKLGEVGAIHCQTWGETATRARRLATALLDHGIAEGDRIASLAWNTHRHLELYFGVTGIGAVLHTVNPRLSLEHLTHMLNEAGNRVVFYDGSFAGLVAMLKPLCPGVGLWVQLSHAPQPPAWTDLPYEDFIAGAAPLPDWPELDEHGAAALCYTSGTTGLPKGVLYSHRALVLESMTANGPDALSISRADTVAPVVPMFHVNAWSIPFGAAMAGADLALPEGMIRAFRDSHGVEVIHGWGMTETAPLGTINALTAQEAATLSPQEAAQVLKRQGRAPFGVALQITGKDGQALPRDGDAQGHLRVRGHWVIDSYFGQSQPATDGGWFDTGDVATISADAVMTITDRDKDLIKSGGEWISSVQLEEIALACPGVADAAAIAVPHPKWDERPLVVVVRDAGAGTGTGADAEALRQSYAQALPKWQLPDIAFTDQLPLGATGKVLKHELRQRFAGFHNGQD